VARESIYRRWSRSPVQSNINSACLILITMLAILMDVEPIRRTLKRSAQRVSEFSPLGTSKGSSRQQLGDRLVAPMRFSFQASIREGMLAKPAHNSDWRGMRVRSSLGCR
jgi:hypothetical protein